MLDMFRQFYLGFRIRYFILPVLQILFINIIVGRSFTSKNASKENNRTILWLHQSEAVNILKIKLQRMKLEIGEGGRDKDVGGLIKMECPTLFSLLW